MKTLKNIFAVAAFSMVLAVASFAQTSLPSLGGGGNVDVQGRKGKVAVLAVGATWLPLSGKQAQFTNALVKSYAGKNVVFYFIATDSTNAKSKNYATDDRIREWAAANKVAVTVLRDSDGAEVTKKFALDQLPAFIVLDKNGGKADDFTGIDPNYDITVPIGKKIDSLL